MKELQRIELESIKERLYEVSASLYCDWTSESMRTAKLARITIGKELDIVNRAIANVSQALDLVDSREQRNWNLRYGSDDNNAIHQE